MTHPSGLFYRLICLLAVSFLLLGHMCLPAAAQVTAPNQEITTQKKIEGVKTLVLSSKSPLYDVIPHLKIIKALPDKGMDGFAEALAAFKAGQGTDLPDNITASPAFFGSRATEGFWLFFTTYNRSQAKSRWMLDFGNLYTGTLGQPDILAVYNDLSMEPLFVDGRKAPYKRHVKGQEKNVLPLTLDAGRNAIIGIYVMTIPGTALSLDMHLKEFSAHRDSNLNNEGQAAVLKLATGLICIVYLVFWNSHRRNLTPLAMILYVLIAYALFTNSDELVTTGNNSISNNVNFLQMIFVLCGVAISKYVLLSGSAQKLYKKLIIGFISLLLLIQAYILLIDSQSALADIFFHRLLPSIGCIVVTLLGTIIIMTKERPMAIPFTLAWVILLVGALSSEIFKTGLIDFSITGANLYWFAFVPHIALLSFSTLRFISLSEEAAKKEITKRKRKTDEEAEMRKARDQANQTRLLSIMQREKELMVDLKNREGERAQALRHAKDVADKANKAKSDFLAVISHEIRTPMTGVMGMIRLLLDTPLNEKQQEYARTIQYSGEALLTLLNDILDLSKAEEGKMSLEILDFDSHKLVESVVLLMSGRAEEKKLSLNANISPGLPLMLKGDPTRLRQILLNLISNAIKFTEKGTVTVSVKMHDNTGKKPRIYFAVTDTGMGISEEAQKKLFTPYAQADASISRNFGGTGLGLAICKRLVDAMGGTIQMQSALGKGTTFYFVIPMDIGEQPKPVISQPKSEAMPLRILVVDDNAINQKVVAGLLDKDGHKIVTCGGAEIAMQELEKSAFDVILMDMEMPQIDGITATKMIRALPDPVKAKTSIVAMTANTRREDIQRCKDAGMNDHISKPVSPENLRALLAQISKQINPITAGQSKSQPSGPALKVVGSNEQSAVTENAQLPKLNAEQSRKYYNPDMIGSLKSSLGPAQMDDMMQSLYQKTEELIAAVEKAITDSDLVAISTRGHDIKGMTSNFGLTALSDLGGRLERQAKEKIAISTLAEIAAQLRPTYEETKRYVDEFLKS